MLPLKNRGFTLTPKRFLQDIAKPAPRSSQAHQRVFPFRSGKNQRIPARKKITLLEKVLQQVREEKADAVLILKEKGNAENGYISAEFYQK